MVTVLGWLYADGKLLKDELGQTVVLRGTNWQDLAYRTTLEGEAFGANDPNTRLDMMINAVSPEKKIDVVGIYTDYKGVVDIEAYLSVIDSVVDALGSRNIYTILYWNPSGWTGDERWLEVRDGTDWINYWRLLADRYKDKPWVMYYLVSEGMWSFATDTLPDAQVIWYNRSLYCCQQIRAVNPNALIFVPTIPPDGGMLYDWSTNGWLVTGFLPLDNIVYATQHHYRTYLSPTWLKPWSQAYRDGNFTQAKALYEQELLDHAFVPQEHNKPAFVPSMGSSWYTHPNWDRVNLDFYDLATKYGVGWSQHAWHPHIPAHLCEGNWQTLSIYGEVWKQGLTESLPTPIPPISPVAKLILGGGALYLLYELFKGV